MNRSVASIALFSAIFTSALMANPAQAQVAEVPTTNAKGDFTTSKVMGNRGLYQNTKWLIVDSGSGLNCRVSPNGTIKSVLMPGSVVPAVFPSSSGDAIVMHQGSPWLRVSPQVPDYGSGTPGACFVRANIRYIAPISEDFTRNGTISLGK